MLNFNNGSIAIDKEVQTPYSTFDPRDQVFRSKGLHYHNIIQYLEESEIPYQDNVNNFIPFPAHLELKTPVNLRDYQKKSIENWAKAGKKGCIILPTGSGKTLIGVKIIEIIKNASIIIVPTIDLMHQWNAVLSKYFQNDMIGMIGGGQEDIKPITICTYDSAYIKSAVFGNRFDLVIFDEVHHLASPGYRNIAENLTARYRLGLTATIKREDGKHKDLPSLIGGIVYEQNIKVLSKDKFLADFEIELIKVELTPSEKKEYDNLQKTYVNNLVKMGLHPGKHGYEKLILMSGSNNIAKDALQAKRKANDIALNSDSKILALKEALIKNKNKKTIIFTEHNKLVYEISNRFLIPFITHKSDNNERKEVIENFKKGVYSAIVTSKVFDEGIDVPDAEVGIIMSGTGSKREFIQRLGRILRPKSNNQKAKLIEIISVRTTETIRSKKRKQDLDV